MLHKTIIFSATCCLFAASLYAAELNNPADIAELAKSNVSGVVTTGGDDVPGGITDATCQTFKAALSEGFKQTTSAYQTVLGAMSAATSGGISFDQASVSVTQGIDSCLDYKLDHAVIAAIQDALAKAAQDPGSAPGGGSLLAGGSPTYLPPPSAYNPPELGQGPPIFPAGQGTRPSTLCVSNCI